VVGPDERPEIGFQRCRRLSSRSGLLNGKAKIR
jgi:hypothetical protein